MAVRQSRKGTAREDIDYPEMRFHASSDARSDAREAQRLARGRNIALLRQTAAAGIVTGTFALFTSLHQNFTAQALTHDDSPTTHMANNIHAPLAPTRPLPPSLMMEDPVLIQNRAIVMQEQSASIRLPAAQVPFAVPQTQAQARAQGQTQQAAQVATQNMNVVFEDFIDHLLLREGFENEVYRDTLGVLTVGVGHRVLASDNLREGQTISNERVRQFLYKDAQKAFDAAQAQAAQLGVRNNPDFIIALASVNFQLGTGWNNIHRKTWALMEQGRFRDAATEAANSAWNRQTPVRVRDFQDALRALEPAAATAPAKGRKLSATFEEAHINPADEPQGPYKMRSVDLAQYQTNGASTLVLAA